MIGHVMTKAERMCLHTTADDLHTEFRGIFGTETIEALFHSSYNELAAKATVTRWLIVGAERFARQRLQALAYRPPCSRGLRLRRVANRRRPLGAWRGLATDSS